MNNVTQAKTENTKAAWKRLASSLCGVAGCFTAAWGLCSHGKELTAAVNNLLPSSQMGDVFTTIGYGAIGMGVVYLIETAQHIRLIRAERRNAAYGEGVCLNPVEPK